MKGILHLKDVVDINAFQKIQDDIADATEMSIITVDYKGKPATKHSKCSGFCKLMRASDTYSQLCERCDSHGGLEAARLEKPYIYRCHKGLIDFATPIIVDGQYLGSVMAGQVLMKDDSDIDLEDIVNIKNDFDDLEKSEKEIIIEAYSKLPVVNFERIQAVAQMMFHISNYIVGEAVSKMVQKEIDEKRVKFAGVKKVQVELEKEYRASQLKALQSQGNPHFLFNVLNSISSLDIVEKVPKTKEVINEGKKLPIKAAIDYIHDNLRENITLEKMASICNLSPCYFSKVFKKEIGVTFISYVNYIKINKAKEVLENTDIPILNVALDLGFEDCGYFIRVFKKSQGVTPKKYREKYRKQ